MDQKLCPQHKVAMEKVTVTSTVGTQVALEQCPECGGIWFDNLELFEVNSSAAAQLKPLDSAKLSSQTPLESGALACPNDQTTLEMFHDPYFPQSLQIEHCPQCDGFWLNYGQFQEFEQSREQRVAEMHQLDDALSKSVDAALISDPSRNTYDSLGHLGKFLSVRPGTAELDPQTIRSLQRIQTVFMVLGILARLFLHV